MIKAEFQDKAIAIKENGKSILTINVDRNPEATNLINVLHEAGVLTIEVDNTEFKSTMHKHREKAGLTHEQLADLVGCSRQTIVKIETGISEPKLKLAIKLADVLNMDVRDILN